MSRRSHPKQYRALVNGRSLLQNAVLRFSRRDEFADPVIVASMEHRHLAEAQCREQGAGVATIIVEPVARDTALAVATAALRLVRTDPEAIMVVVPAGQVIEPAESLVSAVRLAKPAAAAGWLVTFGVSPSAPDTGLGYLEITDETVCDHVFRATAYTREPSLEAALRFVESGRHYWNSGILLCRARTLLDEMRQHAPDILGPAEQSVERSVDDEGFVYLDRGPLDRVRSASIWRAVVQSSSRVAIAPVPGLGWSNLATWHQLYELSPQDDRGNAVFGEAVLVEADSNLAYMDDGRVLVALGVCDLIVVSTPDALLVAHRSSSPDLKETVDVLRREHPALLESGAVIQAAWGTAEVLHRGSGHQVLRISMKPGGRRPAQRHYHRAEHWTVVEGTARVTRDGQVVQLTEGESIYLPVGTLHRLENPGRLPLALIEVRSGQYLAEDDNDVAETEGAAI